jgi:hypothetical protein
VAGELQAVEMIEADEHRRKPLDSDFAFGLPWAHSLSDAYGQHYAELSKP